MPAKSDKTDPVVSKDSLEWQLGGDGNRYAHQRKGFTLPAGGKALGCSLYQVPVGKAAFPMHQHYANEEALYILQGQAELRLNDTRHALRAGHYVALPPGSGQAHQLFNTGDSPVVYLCMSTMVSPDVVEYPETNKIGAFGHAPGGVVDRKSGLREFFFRDESVDIYKDEP